MERDQTVSQLPDAIGNKVALENDDRTPNQRRLDEIIDLNEDMLEVNRAILVQMTKLNANLAIVGQALIKMAEKPVKVVKKGA